MQFLDLQQKHLKPINKKTVQWLWTYYALLAHEMRNICHSYVLPRSTVIGSHPLLPRFRFIRDSAFIILYHFDNPVSMINEMRTRLTKQNREATRMCDVSVRVCVPCQIRLAVYVYMKNCYNYPISFGGNWQTVDELWKQMLWILKSRNSNTSNGKG